MRLGDIAMNMRSVLFAALGAACVLGFSMGTAHAQTSATEELGRKPIVSGTGERKAPRNEQPPALPGTQINRDRVIPAEHAASDMPPTEALFDAVNRGDVAAARDAIARGADFNGRNALGMTPLDESIDLARNDITFMLLSLRGAFGEPSSAPQVMTRPAAKATAKPAQPVAAQKVATAPVPAPKPEMRSAAPSPAITGQMAGPASTGTPDAKSGFLGFGG